MKKALCLLCFIILLCGCDPKNSALDQAIQFRSRLQDSNGCSFDTVITADYGDKIYTFEMQCSTDSAGNLEFIVTKPDSISNISGKISSSGGQLIFDDQILAFPTLVDDQISPVSAPWVLIHALTGGYIRSAASQNSTYTVSIDDSYQEDSLALNIQINTEGMPVSADIIWKDRRILFLEINNFSIL